LESITPQVGKLNYIGDIRANAAGYEEMALRVLHR